MFFKLPEWRYLRYKIQDRWKELTTSDFKFFRLSRDKYFWYRIQERWERLAVRQWFNQHPRIIIAVACVSAILFLMIGIGQVMPKKTSKVEAYDREWFYDLNTGKLFVAKIGQDPPIEAPSGSLPNGEPAGVRAYVFSYEYDADESEQFIGFLETLTPEARKYKDASVKSARPKRWGQDSLISRVEDDEWVPIDSTQGRAILAEFFLPDEKGWRAVYCPPK